MRTWTDNTGQYQIEGCFVARLNDGTIRLILADGRYVRVSFARSEPGRSRFRAQSASIDRHGLIGRRFVKKILDSAEKAAQAVFPAYFIG